MIFGEVSNMNLQEVAMAAVVARGEALRYVAPSLLSDAALVLAAARMLDCFAGDNGKIQVFQTKNKGKHMCHGQKSQYWGWSSHL